MTTSSKQWKHLCKQKQQAIGRWEKEEVATWKEWGWREGDFGFEQADGPNNFNWAGEVVTWAQCPKKQDGEQKRIESNTKFKSTATAFQWWGLANEDNLKQLQESEIDLNETALGQEKEIELKKMGTVMQHLNFGELVELEGKMRAVREAKINKIKANKILLKQAW